ncbi:MAG: serine/threonine-protein kinase [Solirubrobacterales bacterium]
MGIRTQTLRGAVMGGGVPTRTPARLRDRFELLVPLGSGGFGTVWEGFDMLLERPVAIKELPINGELSDAGDAMREARATARLNHPTIVSLYEIVSEADRIYMISELVHGSTLDELIDEGLLSDQDCGRIGYALCEALAHAHSHGVVHRDVKPGNVIVTDEWLNGVSGWRAQPAKLMDFGIASIVDSETGHGPHAGSRGYVSPEQEAGDAASPASDVYSLALVLFECLTGSGPGRGRHGRLVRVRQDLPVGLAECIDRCLELDPLIRPGLAELEKELSLALPHLSEDLAVGGFFARSAARVRRMFGSEAEAPPALVGDYPRSPWVMRVVCGAVAAAASAATMAAAGLTVQPAPLTAAAAIAVAMPYFGWSVALATGAIALSVEGQPGSGLILMIPALVAFIAAVRPAGRLLAGAIWGVAAFLWTSALQAISGQAMVVSPLVDLPAAADARESVSGAAEMLGALAQPVYAASSGLWALVAVISLVLVARRSTLPWWAALGVVAIAGQMAVAQALEASLPPVTVVAAILTLISSLFAAAGARRLGRVFGQQEIDPRAVASLVPPLR